MSDLSNEVLIGQVLANQEFLRSRLEAIDAKIDARFGEVEQTLREHRDVFTFLKGQRSAILWVSGVLIAAAAAMGISINKVFAWLAALK
jgi:hypothetical protein